MVTHYYLSDAKKLGKLTETNFLEYCNNFRKLAYPVLNGDSEHMLKNANTYEKVFAAIIYSIHKSSIYDILKYIDIGLTGDKQVEYVTNLLMIKMASIDNTYIRMIIGDVVKLYENYKINNFVFDKKQFTELSEIVNNLSSNEKDIKDIISILEYLLNGKLLYTETYIHHNLFYAMMKIIHYQTIFDSRAFYSEYDEIYLDLVSHLLNIVKRKNITA